MRTAFPLSFAFAALCGCAANSVRIPGENVRSKPLPYPQFSHYLESREQAPVYAIGFQRDSVDAKLFISFYFRKGDEPAYRTLIVNRDGISEVGSSAAVWYDDLENPMIRLEGAKQWYDNKGRFFSRFEDAKYIFQGGGVIPYKAVSAVRGVLGGDFVLLRFTDKNVWTVSRTDSPWQPVFELPKYLEEVQRAFAAGDALIVFGGWRPQTGYAVECLVYQKSSAGYGLTEKISIPWGGTVYDMDVRTGDALIAGKGQFAAYYRFNIRTKRRARLGFAPGDDVLFLKDDVIRTLDAAMQKAK